MFVSPRHRVSLLDRKVGQFAHQVLETLPETAAELASLLESAQADINVIRARHAAGETLTGADATRLRALLADVDRVGAAHAAAVLAEADAAPADADEIGALLAQADAPADEAPEGSATDAPADEAPEGGDAPADAPAGDVPQVPVAASGQPAPVTNGSRPVTFGAAVTGAEPETPEGDTPTPGWVMQPGVPGYQPNAKVGFAQLAKQLDTIRPGSRSVRGNRPDKYMDGQSFSAQVVSALTRDVEVVDDPHALVAAINKATSLVKGERVTAQSLTAAGGWCAPSEQLYDFCDVPDATDLLSLPEITINRGGIRWPREPDLSGIFEDFEWFFTEPELEATDPVTGAPTAIKQCVEIPCPEDFDEIRLNAVGWCVEAGILQEQGWPELIEWFMRSLTQEHLRALSRRSILNIVAGSGAAKVIPPASVLGSVASVLNSLALVATNIRLKRGLSRTATIEGIAPSWFFEVLRADLAFREGTDTFAVTDAQILGWLTARNIALQFVGDWQTRAAGLPGHMDTLKWPTTVDIVMYPAGTWFRSMSNVIELGVMYPKEQLQVNRFTRMFTEDAIAVGKRCGESVLVRVPLDVNGAIGERLAASNA